MSDRGPIWQLEQVIESHRFIAQNCRDQARKKLQDAEESERIIKEFEAAIRILKEKTNVDETGKT